MNRVVPWAWALCERGAGMVLGALGFAVLARLLSPTELGGWMVFLSFATFAHMWREGLVRSGVQRFAAGADDVALGRTLGAALVVQLGAVGLLTLLCMVCALPLSWTFDISARLWFALPLWAVLETLVGLATLAWQAREQFRSMAVQRVIIGVQWVLGLLLLFLLEWRSAEAVLIVLLISRLVGALFGLVNLRGLVRHVRPAHAEFVQLLNHGRFSQGTRLGSAVTKGLDVVLLGLVVGPISAGLYGAASKVADYADLPVQAAGTVLVARLSRVARQDPLRAQAQARRLALIGTLCAVPVSVSLWLLGPTLLVLLAGPAFADAAGVLGVLALFFLARPADRIQGIVLDAIGQPQVNLEKVLLVLLLNVVGDALVLQFSASPLTGVALVSVISTALGMAWASVRITPAAVERSVVHPAA